MAENRGVFRLRTLRTENVQGDGVAVTDAWVPPAPIATADASYMVGGLMNEYNSAPSASNVSSQTDKITYTTSTTSRLPGSNLDNPMYGGLGMSSLVAMYSGGGPNIPGLNPNQTNVRKLTYSTGSWALLPGVNGLKAEPKQSTQGVGDGMNFGYYFGGANAMDGSPRTSYTQKYTFAYDLSERLPSANLSYDFYGATAAGNQEKAIVTGGNIGSPSSLSTKISKLTYSNETMVQAPGIYLGNSKYKGDGEAAAANNQYIWYAGGMQIGPQGGAIIGQTTVSRLTMSIDSIEYSLPSTQLTYPTFRHGGVDNGSDGYFAGGNSWNNPGPAGPGGPYSSANKLTFSNGTMAATPGANLTQAKSLMQTAGPRQYSTPSPGPGGAPYRWIDDLDPNTLNLGYWSGGGGSPSQTSSTDQIDFNSNTCSALPSSTMPRQGMAYAGVLSDTTKVLVSGGEPSGGNNDFIKFTYATKTYSFLPGAYPGVKRTRNNDNNSIVQPSVGYIVAGQNDSGNVLISSTDKITFATDTATTVPGANYSHAANYIASWGDVNLAHGYAYGGNRDQPSSSDVAVSTINKLTYATETVSNIPANIGTSPGSFAHSSMSSSTHGYIMGGRYYPGSNEIPGDVEKFNFSTETRSTVPQPGPAYRNYYANATGNSTDGYSGGGQATNYPQRYSTVRKLSFTTETFSVLGEISSFPWPGSGRSQSAAFSQMSNGKPVPTAPTVTPTSQTVPLLSPSATNTALTAFGYNPKSGSNPMAIYKTNLATDTNLGESATLSIRRFEYASNSTETNGYFHAGKNPSGSYAPNSDKVNYATDSRSQIPGLMGGTTGNWRGFGATGNPTHGYSAGGLNWPSGYSTHFLKMTWSSDSTQEIPATLNQGRIFINATGNREVGYWIGGEGNSPAAFNTTDKMVYSSDTASVLPSITAGRSKAGAVSGSPYSGYLLGGEDTPSSNTNSGYKINMSNETGSVVPSISLNGHPSYMKYFAQASGNTTDGYTFGGASSNPSGHDNTGVQKLTYSSETVAYAPGAALPLPLSDGASTTARDHSISQNPSPVNL